MTIKSMNMAIQNYCKNHGDHDLCESCLIESLCDSVCGCFEENADECIQAFETLRNLGEIPEETTYKKRNPYWENVCELAKHQRSKGIGKYGKGLEDNPAAMAARITHLQEELIDGLMYCEWIKDKLRETEGEKHE